MNINFTDKEYRLLLDAVFIANWVMTAHDTGPQSDDDRYQMLFQKIYSYAKEAGCAGLVAEETDSNRYCPSRRYEEESDVFDWIEEYNAHSFWDELIDRLAERDVLDEASADEVSRMAANEYWRRAAPYERKYSAELEKYGIDRLIVDESRGPVGQ